MQIGLDRLHIRIRHFTQSNCHPVPMTSPDCLYDSATDHELLRGARWDEERPYSGMNDHSYYPPSPGAEPVVVSHDHVFELTLRFKHTTIKLQVMVEVLHSASFSEVKGS